MTAPLESLLNVHQRFLQFAEGIGGELSAMESELLAAIVEERDRIRRENLARAITGVSGLPCTGELTMNAEPECATHACAIPNPDERDEPPAVKA